MFGGLKRSILVVYSSTGPFSDSGVEKQTSEFAREKSSVETIVVH